MPNTPLYCPDSFPSGIRSRLIDNGNGLQMHVLEAGQGCEVLLFLHGFPEIAYSWRKIMPTLAKAGFRVVAPDLRGYGLTTGWDADYDCDLSLFRPLYQVRDLLGLLAALEIDYVTMIVGHDYGASLAAYSALIRPDIFRSLSLMSAPFTGPPHLISTAQKVDIVTDLQQLSRPRKHYQRYYATREANEDMAHSPEGVHDFLRAYYHYKSSDWNRYKPFERTSWSAVELAKMPTYNIMDFDKNMAETVAVEMPTVEEINACTWLPDEELLVYSDTYARTGFQGALNHYRCRFISAFISEQQLFSKCAIKVPTCFISGASDWGVYQVPGALEAMKRTVCNDFRDCQLIEGAGHWVQQEHPGEVIRHLLAFLAKAKN